MEWVKVEPPLALRRDYDEDTCEEQPSFQGLDCDPPAWAVPGVCLLLKWDDGVVNTRYIGDWNRNLGACDCCSPSRRPVIIAYRLPEEVAPPCL